MTDDAEKKVGRVQERRGRWSRTEIYKLKQLYGTRDDAQIARLLRRSVQSVRRMAESVFSNGATKGASMKGAAALGRRKAVSGPWLPEDVERLRERVGAASLETISLVLGRTTDDVKAKMEELARTVRTGAWSHEEVRALKLYYGSREDNSLVVILQRSLDEIQNMASSLHLAKDKAFLRRRARDPKRAASAMPRWTPEQVEQLRALYPDHSNLEIADSLGRTVKSVMSKANELRLRKCSEQREEVGRRNVGVRYGRGSEIPVPPGQKPMMEKSAEADGAAEQHREIEISTT